ncbi:hypothetical protein [Rubrivivax gelatinosus]|uniref:Uncharacterized protein n=1 Tax=Rubrivivax gelatinosus TaxID=28068 RepID=A0ABS1DZX4_RUBGE|nr:hypothetical protein [Rubrivivax gelatinosus]MBK1715662.1 hypothetical protein [Rubrivivax gelatinosus]
MRLDAAEQWVLQQCAAGGVADLAAAPAALGSRTLRAEALRLLLLGVPVETPGKPAEAALLPCGLVVANAVIAGRLDLTRAHSPRGDAACPPLVLRGCRFDAGGVPPQPQQRPLPDIDLSHARIAHLSLVDCRLSHLDLREAQIDGEFDFSGLAAPADGALCRIDASGAAVRGSVHGLGAKLELAPDPAHPAHQPAPMALLMRDAVVGGSLHLRAGFVARGGVRLPRRVGGDVWLEAAELHGAGSGEALMGQRCEVAGGVAMRPGHGGGRVLPFIANGALNLVDIRVGQGLVIDLASTAPSPGAGSAPALTLSNAKVGGDLYVDVDRQPVQARALRVGNEANFTAHGAAAPALDLTFATFGPSLFLGGGFGAVDLHAACGGTLICVEPGRPRDIALREARFSNTMTLRADGELDLRSLCCDDSVEVWAAQPAALRLRADSASVGHDLVLHGRFVSVALARGRIDGRLDLRDAAVEEMAAVGLRVRAQTLLPGELLGPVDLSSGLFEGGVATGAAVTRLHVRRVNSQLVVAELNLEDARVVGDLKIDRLVREPETGVARVPARLPDWLQAADARFELHERVLRCYPDATLVELHRRVDGGAADAAPEFEIASFIVSAQHSFYGRLDGNSAALHDANAPLGLTLQNADQAVDYLRLFCGCLWGAETSFVLAEPAASAPWLQAADAEAQAAVEAQLQPPSARAADGGGWDCEATLVYQAELFASSFHIAADGQVTMTADRSLAKLAQPPFADAGGGLRRYRPRSADERWHQLSGDWQRSDDAEARQSLVVAASRPRVETGGEAGAHLPVRVRLGGCRCDTLDDDDGRSWGDDADGAAPRVRAELAGFVYDDLADGLRASSPRSALNAEATPGAGAPRGLYGLELAERRLKWLQAHAPRDEPFNPRAHEQLVGVLNRRGDEEAARRVLLEKLKAQRRDMAARRPLLAATLYGALELPFQFGLFWRHAVVTVLAVWFAGAWFFDAANHGGLRVLPLGSASVVWDFGRVPTLVVDSRAVADVVMLEHGEPVQATRRADAAPGAVSELRCGEQIEPLVYALDAMVPLLDLHQEDRCTISGDAEAVGWRLGSAFYSLLGAYVTSLFVLTISGVLRRSVER